MMRANGVAATISTPPGHCFCVAMTHNSRVLRRIAQEGRGNLIQPS